MTPLNRGDRIWAALIFSVSLFTYAAAARTQGNVRDEGYYFDAAEPYFNWYVELADNVRHGKPGKSFTRASVDRWFNYNHEHPALMKTLFGASDRAFGKRIGPEPALRLPTHILSAAMIAVVFLFGVGLWGRRAGFVAAGLTLGAPRLFFDAQLAAFDAPIAAFWVFVTYAYARALTDRRWAWRAGVLFGLALATKHNAFFIPPLLVVHYLYVLWVQRGSQIRLPIIPRVFWWMALAGPVVYLACWPWLWFSTVARFREYVGFHVNHVYYNMEFLGTNYNKPPFPLSFPYVMTALTLPVTTLVLSLYGSITLFAQRRQKTPGAPGLLLVLNAVFPMAIITITGAPIFGATKHWHASVPFVALLAAYGTERILSAIPTARRTMIGVIVAIAVISPSLAETWRSHPYGLSHYNLLAGGPPGGADLGMNRQFWGYATRGLLPELNRRVQSSPRIYWHDTNTSQLGMYRRMGTLRADIANSNSGMEEPGVRASNWALVIHEKHFNKYEYWIWDAYGTTQPTLVLDDEGVPLVTLYQRPKKP